MDPNAEPSETFRHEGFVSCFIAKIGSAGACEVEILEGALREKYALVWASIRLSGMGMWVVQSHRRDLRVA